MSCICCLSLAEFLIFNNKNVTTPLHLGLEIPLHHEYGKRGFTDTLFSHSFNVSLDELRHFMTTIAQDQLSRIEAGIYVHLNVINGSEGGQLIQQGADNIDINAGTIDGKNTFHPMAK